MCHMRTAHTDNTEITANHGQVSEKLDNNVSVHVPTAFSSITVKEEIITENETATSQGGDQDSNAPSQILSDIHDDEAPISAPDIPTAQGELAQAGEENVMLVPKVEQVEFEHGPSSDPESDPLAMKTESVADTSINEVSSNPVAFVCTVCSKSFQLESSLTDHLKTHNPPAETRSQINISKLSTNIVLSGMSGPMTKKRVQKRPCLGIYIDTQNTCKDQNKINSPETTKFGSTQDSPEFAKKAKVYQNHTEVESVQEAPVTEAPCRYADEKYAFFCLACEGCERDGCRHLDHPRRPLADVENHVMETGHWDFQPVADFLKRLSVRVRDISSYKKRRARNFCAADFHLAKQLLKEHDPGNLAVLPGAGRYLRVREEKNRILEAILRDFIDGSKSKDVTKEQLVRLLEAVRRRERHC